MTKQSISICIITKNECDMLQKCLEHLSPYARNGGHEIVVVDTGSTDDTVQMCQKYTDKIFFFEWINDFAAARNYATSMASNDWILCIDSDEYVSSWDEVQLQNFIKCNEGKIGTISLRDKCGYGKNQYYTTSHLSRFYNRQTHKFNNPIHEQIDPLNPSVGHHYTDLEIHVNHMSYSGGPEAVRAKSERNIQLLKNELKKDPHNAYTLFQLGQSYYMLEDFESANHYYDLGLAEDVDPDLPFVKTMVVSYGYTLINLKRFQDALNFEGIYDAFSNFADFVFLMGLIYLNNGFFDLAIEQLQKATTFDCCEVEGANSYRAYYNLGVIYECLGHMNEAKDYYTKSLPFAPAAERLSLIQ